MFFFRSRICILFSILLFIEPSFFQSNKYIDLIFDVGKILLFMFLILKCLIQRKIFVSKISIGIICLYLVYCVASVHNRVPIYATCLDIAYVIAFLLLIEISLQIDYRVFVDAITVLLTSLIIINCVLFFIFPDGMYNNGIFDNCWLLGFKNTTIPFILSDLFFLNIKEEYRKEKQVVILEKLLLLIFGTIFAVFARSTTTLIAIIVYIVVFCGLSVIKIKIPLLPVLFLNYVIAGGLILGNFFDTTKDIVYQFTGKSGSWEVRRLLWLKIIVLVKDHLILGNGVYSNEDFANIMGRFWMVHAHNTYLQILFQGGLIATILFFAIISMAIKDSKRYDMRLYNSFFSVMTAFFIIFQSEYYAKIYLFFIILVFVSHKKNCTWCF